MVMSFLRCNLRVFEVGLVGFYGGFGADLGINGGLQAMFWMVLGLSQYVYGGGVNSSLKGVAGCGEERTMGGLW